MNARYSRADRNVVRRGRVDERPRDRRAVSDWIGSVVRRSGRSTWAVDEVLKLAYPERGIAKMASRRHPLFAAIRSETPPAFSYSATTKWSEPPPGRVPYKSILPLTAFVGPVTLAAISRRALASVTDPLMSAHPSYGVCVRVGDEWWRIISDPDCPVDYSWPETVPPEVAEVIRRGIADATAKEGA